MDLTGSDDRLVDVNVSWTMVVMMEPQNGCVRVLLPTKVLMKRRTMTSLHTIGRKRRTLRGNKTVGFSRQNDIGYQHRSHRMCLGDMFVVTQRTEGTFFFLLVFVSSFSFGLDLAAGWLACWLEVWFRSEP